MNEKDNPRSKNYDHSWDDDFDEDSDLENDDYNDEAFERKMEQWDERNWRTWLKQYLTFPFTVIREEDMDADPFREEDESKPFAIDSEMMVLEFGYNEFHDAIMAHVKQGKEEGWVPLADLKVTPKRDPNYWPVREYTVWFANR
ncbi:hypothetical protein L0337_03960 [candidate division KSB1 bacterium]|nr:hypothetical protein [candidate division KSB1 bacterium]